MRILIANCHRAVVGGIEKYLQALVPALVERGHAVAMLYEYGAGEDADTVDPPGAGFPVWCWRDQSPSSILEEVTRWNPDVIYSNGLDSQALEDFVLATGPAVFFAHVYHGTCATGMKWHYSPVPEPCQRVFGPMCLVLHYPRRCGGLNPLTAWRSFQKQAEHHARLADYQSIVVASNHMRGEFEQHGVSPEKLHLAPLPIIGVRPENIDRSSRPAPCSILFAGRLTNMKGPNYLINAIPLAAQQLGRPLTLTIAGEGGERASLEAQAAEAGLEVRFTGWVDTEEMTELMCQADLLAVPSLWPEPFGLVGIEAGCSALPAVGYAVGGIPDWLIAGRTGEIAPGDPPTVQGLADAMVRALADPEHYARLSRGAWELSQQFTLERHLAQLEKILQAACEPNHLKLPASSVALS